MALQLVTVKNEGTTLFARLVSFVAALVTALTQIGLLTAERGEKILGIMNSPTTAIIVSLIGTLIMTFAPSILGWRNRSKELPSGLTVKDVQVKPNAPVPADANIKLAEAARKASLFVLACFTALSISACSCPPTNPNTYPATNAYPAEKLQQMRAQQGQ